MTAFVVVNMRAGRTRRDWPQIRPALESIFPLMTVATSRGRGDTAQLVRAALQDGHLNIIAVGGDGTLNEALNGFFQQGLALSPDAVLGFVTSGTSGDFGRSFGLTPGWQASIARLRQSHVRRIDVGRVSCLTPEGAPVTRYFLNVASFGITARIAERVNRARLGRLFGGKFTFLFHAAAALAFWRPPHLRLLIDGGHDEIAGITFVALANGRWFGAGLCVAPQADPTDGKFDIVVAGGAPRRRLLWGLRAIRNGSQPADPALRVIRAARLTAAPTLDTHGPVAIETDGESVGLLPATFEIYPNAINLRC